MFDHGATDDLVNILGGASRKYFCNFKKWVKHLDRLGLSKK